MFIFFVIALLGVGRSINGTTQTSQDHPEILVTIVRSEHSMDSNSVTTTLSCSGDTLLYQQKRSGAHSGQTKPIERKFKVNNDDRRELASLLAGKLLVTKSISRSSETTPYLSLSFSIRSKLNGKSGLISIDGPRKSTAIKNDPLYKDSLVLINALYRVVHRTEPLLGFDEFVDDTGNE